MKKPPQNILLIAREYLRLSQNELAIKLGRSKSYISELESGKKKITTNILEDYSKHLNIKPSDLLALNEKYFCEQTKTSKLKLSSIDSYAKTRINLEESQKISTEE